jgi:alpha-glucosidase (family GH31 glycosyl hydrolase)
MTNSPPGKPKRRLARIFKVLGLLLLLLVALVYFGFVLPFWGMPFNHSRHGRVPLTPPWALECWLWEDDVNTSGRVTELLEGHARHDVPVRTILIDSPWSRRYNDFKVDERRYPEPEKFFADLQDRGYRVVLWMTCMVNSRNKDTLVANSQDFYEEARAGGYLAGNGSQLRWWKGTGGFIDYSNPDAMRWWHGLQDQVLQWGIDGWKLDGCDTLFFGKVGPIPVPYNRVFTGWMTTRKYMDRYSREELRHGLGRNPEFVTLIRSMDRPWSHPEGFAPLDAAPVTWVGDNRHTWAYQDRGLEAALTDILGSAKLGYCVVGSDVAGYHGRSNPDDIGPGSSALLQSWKKTTPGASDPAGEYGTAADDDIAPNLYIRWAQFSTFCGLFLNGGHGERRLWKRSPAELEIIRKFSWLHTELVPYMYSGVVECHRGGPPLMRPLDRGKFHYLFGPSLLVAPITADRMESMVSLPPSRWRYLFKDDQVHEGPAQIVQEFPLDQYPVFVRSGAIIPVNVSRPYTGFGDTNSAGFTTWLVYPDGTNQFTLWHPESHPRPEQTTLSVSDGPTLKLEFAGKHQPHILRIFAQREPVRVLLDGTELQEGTAWKYDAEQKKLVVRTSAYAAGKYEIEMGNQDTKALAPGAPTTK